jgi:hypothetical protein
MQSLTADPLRRDAPIDEQLRTRLGAVPIDMTRESAIGRFVRDVATFELAGTRLSIAFAPLQPGVYTAERAETSPPSRSPMAETELSGVYAALDAQDWNAALALLDSASPPTSTGLEARYIRALVADITGNRDAARAAYFTLWADAPASAWGQAAAYHLEQQTPSG